MEKCTIPKKEKMMKVFGPDDHEALKMVQENLIIHFLSADERGFKISKKESLMI